MILLRKFDLCNYHVIKIWLIENLKYRDFVMMDLWYTVLYWPPLEGHYDMYEASYVYCAVTLYDLVNCPLGTNKVFEMK